MLTIKQLFLSVVVVGLLTGCPLLQSDPNLIGLLTVDGPEGFLNGQPVQGEGIPIHNNDHVATGSGTGMRIQMWHYANTYIQLDQNTDPDLIQEADCLWVRMIRGKLFAEGTSLCLESPDLAAALHSQVILAVQPTKGGGTSTRSVLWVVAGNAELTKPEVRQVPAGYEQVVSSVRGVEPLRQLSATELRDATAWRLDHPRLLQPFRRRPVTPVNVTPTQPPPASTSDPTPPTPNPNGSNAKSRALSTVAPAWCCLPNGAIQQGTTLSCQRLHGKSYPDERTARASCPVTVK